MIFINDIPSLRDPESSELSFDDRVEKVELINGNGVQDYGHVESGDVNNLTCVFSAANYERLKALWAARQRVNYTDEAGIVSFSLRLVFRKIKYVRKFPHYVTLTFELWRC